MWMKGRMVPKCKLFGSIPLHVLKLNYKEGFYELEDHVGEEALNLDLSPKLGIKKKLIL